jgi:hypothetical protein
LQIAQQVEKNKRALDELSEIQKQVILKSKKQEVIENPENSDTGITDSDVNREDIGEIVNSEKDPADKPLNSMYNGF